MRKQVIEIFSEWMEHYLTHREEYDNGSNDCRLWVDTNHPEVSEETVEAVVKSFERTPDAICSWEFTDDRVLNIIIRKENKQNP